ncbi:DUF4145 domain-containing protein [Serratia sp. JSRIV004]|uniref:DUF4145 domain-containing protein n=1 Tax=Serratia sp. JSRIV004 TaxID=2831895 RepID=UPI001CBC7031|nr:DUF4145 domain-containing protein [Serratia sp. JSRIV004]UAN59896.1 DUF4145 domain-containing protein [Serratia sp. JSRIV004]
MSSWECPYCGSVAVYENMRKKSNSFFFSHENKYGPMALHSAVFVCPNENCKEYTVGVYITKSETDSYGNLYDLEEVVDKWRLKPQANVKLFPDYIPIAILDDYKESVLIRDLSPKAAATLARRCLQGMIRDFWEVKPGRLVDEINGIKDKVDHSTWSAIDAIRSIGNIGAHMEKDINLIVDVEPDEADLLIRLIETLLNDWYVEREERNKRTRAIVDLARIKQEERKHKA